ncbi:MAG: 23S rRNA (pseudouridine(1915)-N(3))-methyltransferase RlmH [Gemmatimonadaceae bacterium]|jgi:23S rRNA (pseudouridine1915-N3)-methyltransferase
MRVVVAAVGRPKHGEMATAIDEYERRAARYWPLEWREVREEPARSRAPDEVREREGARLLEAAGSATVLVACDAEGTLMRSTEFAGWLRGHRDDGRDVAFMIGGAYGLSDEVRRKATLLLAFARWTLPHDLARLVLAEQLYRAGTIGRGEPYHK